MLSTNNFNEVKVNLNVQMWFDDHYHKNKNKPYLAVAGRCGVNKKFYYSVRFPIIDNDYLTWPETFFSNEWHKIKRKINHLIGYEINYIETSCLDIPSVRITDSSNVTSIFSKKVKTI